MTDNFKEQQYWQERYFSKKRVFRTSRAKSIKALITLVAAIFAGLLAVQVPHRSGLAWIAVGLLSVVLVGGCLLMLELGIKYFEARDALFMMKESVVREEKESRGQVFGQLIKNNRFLEWFSRLYNVLFVLFVMIFFVIIALWIGSLLP